MVPNRLRKVWYFRHIYLFLLPAIIWFLVFAYYPMYGILIAFKDFKYNLGILGSPWAGFKYFEQFLHDSSFYEVLRNTLSISALKLVFGFPAPLILALMLNAVMHEKIKRVFQTISYLPHFVSWVVVVTLLQKILSPNVGLINDIRYQMGLDPIFFMGKPELFYPLVLISDVWKGVGWGSIIYLAALTNIDPHLYEAAEIDGAGRWSKLFKITLPCLTPTIAILLIFSLSGILNAGFDQIWLMQTPATLGVSEILDTYVLKTGLQQGQLAYSTAIGLFKSAISLLLIVAVNHISRRVSEVSLW
ncbi:putative multiple-sugar transport system permease YteP [compost metagenome]|uniref:Sugar ABC transporter permease n=1 Tax=Paenibacillus rhizolycopersici TaxID=2780073 RepID=A0ABS2H5S2_9BACL|nr:MULTISPECIES: ABC transporter permease subunit [Paenibacillus]MBM6995294.1 sugar ABC transporter permease [Paenibacillus rhizolycopersici]MUG85372.1 ABC transporter permease subunit [Paenibacillus timonensis]GIP46891.1 maltose ABC transporter permease [Paenibacillus sp. J53TS2]